MQASRKKCLKSFTVAASLKVLKQAHKVHPNFISGRDKIPVKIMSLTIPRAFFLYSFGSEAITVKTILQTGHSSCSYTLQLL